MKQQLIIAVFLIQGLSVHTPAFAQTSVDETVSSETKHGLVFGGLDLWRDGSFLHGGAIVAPGGLDGSGLVLKVVGSTGQYRFQSNRLGVEVTGQKNAVFFTPGWHFAAERLHVSLFSGFDTQSYRLTPDDPSAGLRGNHFGARAEINVWYEPTPDSMLSADADISSIGQSYNARLAYGRRVFDRFYVGPEAQTFGDPNYRAMRFGAHLTAWRTGWAEWSAGLGLSINDDGHTGSYLRVGGLGRL